MMRTIEKLREVYEELKKYDQLTLNDILRVIEARLGVTEGTAKMYARMLVRHEYVVLDPNTMMFKVRKEEKEEKEKEEK